MRKLLLVIRKEYLERVRSRAFIVGTVLGPIAMLALTVGPSLLAARSGVGNRRLVVIDQTSQGVTASLQQDLAREEQAPAGPTDEGDASEGGGKGNGFIREAEKRAREHSHIELVPYDGSPTDLKAAHDELAPKVEKGVYDGYLVIPSDFFETGKATFHTDNLSGVVWLDMVEQALGRVLTSQRMQEMGLDKTQLDRVTQRASVKKLALDQKAQGSLEVRLVAGFVMIMLLYIMILMYGQFAMQGVIEDKASRVVEVMLASVTPSQLMMGKLIGNGLVGLTQFAIWGLFVVGLAGQASSFVSGGLNLSFLTPALWVYFALFFALGFVLFSTMYAAVGALCNSTQDAQQLVWPITIFVVIPILLLQVVLRDPDSSANAVLSLIPFFTPILMFIRVIVGKPPLWQQLLSVVLLLGTVVVLSRATAKLFRLGILMYGKPPTWGQVIRMLRAAD